MTGRALALIVVLAAGASSCSKGPPPPAAAPAVVREGRDGLQLAKDAPQWKYVQLDTARLADSLAPARYPAHITVDEQRTFAISSPLPGRIDRIVVKLGDEVATGARLFSIRSGALAEVVKQFETATAQVAARRRTVERTRALVELKAAPEKELQAAEADLREAELTLTAARARRESIVVASEGPNRFWVTAPHLGVITEIDASVGQEVTPEREKPIVRLSELSEVLVIADVPESDAREVVPGGKAQVRAQGDGQDRVGRIEHVSRVVVAARRTVEVRIRVSNWERGLRPNGFAEVTFEPTQHLRRVRIPTEAVVTDGGRSVVFVARDEGKLERVEVETGRQYGGEVEVLSGLPAGTRYVSRGALLLLNEIDLAR